MGRLKEWGMEVLEDLGELYMKYGKLDRAKEELINQLSADSTIDKGWLVGQVNYVAAHPEMFGRTTNYWKALDVIRARSGGRRRRRIHKRDGKVDE